MNDKLLAPGIADQHFIRGKVPMTKAEIRAVIMSKLRLTGSERIIDIGAGTGSLSIEAALLAPQGQVLCLERNPEALALIAQNAQHFGVNNLEVLAGTAPESLTGLGIFDRIIVGGSGGQLQEILAWCNQHLATDGLLLITAVVLDTLTESLKFLRQHNYAFNICQVAVNRLEQVGDSLMFKALNPIFIIEATQIVS